LAAEHMTIVFVTYVVVDKSPEVMYY